MFKMHQLRIVFMILMICSILTGCITIELPAKNKEQENSIPAGNSEKKETTIEQPSDKTLSSTSNKSGTTLTSMDYKLSTNTKELKFNDIEPLYNVSEDQRFEITFKSDLDASYDLVEAYIKVYSDISCTEESQVFYETDKDYTTNTVYIKPRKQTVAPSMRPFENSKKKRSWGGYQNYYMVITRDMTTETFEELDIPTRMMFTIKSDVEIPNVKFYISDKGLATLEWEKVEGAKEYIIYKGYPGWEVNEYARTTENSFDAFYQNLIEDGYTFDKERRYWINQEFDNAFYVTAVVDGKESRLSNEIDSKKYMDIIPADLLDEDMPYNIMTLKEKLPTHLKVMMKSYDPIITKKYTVEYDYLNPKNFNEGKAVLPYTLTGTSFKGEVIIEQYDKVLAKKLHEEQLLLVRNSGVLEDNIKIVEQNPIEQLEDAPIEDVDLIETLKVTKEPASLTLEETISFGLLNNEIEVNLKDYPLASNFDYLCDLIFTIYSQNPYVMYESGFRYDNETQTLYFEYIFNDKDMINQKRQAIYNKVDEIIAEVIDDGMTDYEKEIALHDYLIERVEYDYKALEDAEKNDFKFISDEFEDSFNPYGILVNNVGVCQSYAESYRLLCDKAGLDCVVVSGTLGTVPHAWNKVQLDGMYYNVDLTNNDIGIPYPVFNASDELITMDYTESEDFALDLFLPMFVSLNNDYDYY